MTARPLVVDACTGTGSWADAFLRAGYRVVGIDLAKKHRLFPRGAEFLRTDMRVIRAAEFRRAYGPVAGVIASPPCTEFSQCWSFNKTRKPRPEEGIEVVTACQAFAAELGAPLILENVRGAEKFLGKAAARCGSFYLWGDIPPVLPRTRFFKGIWNCKKGYAARRGHVRDAALRARIPEALALVIALQWPAPEALR